MTPYAWLQELGPGEVVKTSHRIEKMVCSIGTDANSDIQLRGKGIADVHAQLRTTPKGTSLEAVGGERLVVNGRRCDAHALQAGDVVDIGSVRLRFHIGQQREPAARTVSGPVHAQEDLLGALARFSESLAGSYDVDRLLETMLDSILAVTRASRGVVLLLVDEKPQVRVTRSLTMGTQPSTSPLAISDSIVERVLQTRQPVIVSDALNDREFNAAQSVMDFKICSVLCVPLMVRGELLGAIYLSNDNVVNLFTEESRDVATVFAGQAAMVLRNAILISDLKLSNQSLTQQIERMNFGSLIGACDSMREMFRKIEKVAGTDISVLIEGETGTGKELVAGEIHRRSNRAKGPFVVINCGAIPANLLESELFGHVRGAFTGAVVTRDGKFQQAHGGTLFLDEIGELPLALQVKLLRVLEDRKVSRVGDSQGRDVDIRIVAATNRTLSEEVKTGNFREDLFYRLNVVRLHLAPLRDRGEDVMMLARYFLKRQSEELSVRINGFSEDAVRAMHLHRWPGNIRELENRIKKAVIFCDTRTITAADLDLGALQAGRIEPLNEAKETFARGYVRRILEINGGNRAQTSKDLGVDVRTVFRYLERERDDDASPEFD
ncbi:MAG: sigma 54-interacting transcriptional regulator [Myxococcota bacterium]